MRTLILVAVAGFATICAAASKPEAPRSESTDWPSYNRTLTSERFAPLDMITVNNVAKLHVACTYDLGIYASFQTGPIVVGGNARAYAAADGGPVCGTLAVVPAGTPVSDPVQTSGGRIQVMLLDALWHWAPPVKCAAVRNGPVWLDAGVVGRDFPRR